MGIKVIIQELEARLDPVVSTSFFSRPRAKIESKSYMVTGLRGLSLKSVAEVTVIRTLISGKGTSGTFNTANDENHVDEMTTRGGSVYDY